MKPICPNLEAKFDIPAFPHDSPTHVPPTEPPAGGVKPTIDYTRETALIHQGERIELPCVASQAYPPPLFTWRKDGLVLQLDGRRLVQKGGNLVVAGASVSDSGVYVCEGENSHGGDTATTHLTVTCKYNSLLRVSV